MKKTLTVNLNNIVFHIDDDAYEMLQTYLHEIAEHLSEDERKDILNDIEARIAELFNEKLQKNKNVINLVDVQEIIEIMGKPSQYTGEDDEEEQKKYSKSDKKQNNSRRFYRDPENAILGGVAGGLSAYFNIDVTWIRIILVVLVLLSASFMIPIYIVVWFVAPAAITATQRLEMQGEDVTVENIKTEINNVKNYVESEKFKDSASNVGDRIMTVLRWIFKIVFGLIGAALGMAGIVVVGALIFALFMLIFDPIAINHFAPDIFTNWGAITPERMILMVISLILLVGCPIFLIVFLAIRLISGRQRTNSNRTASLVVLILWFAGLFMFFSVGANSLIHLRNHNGNGFSFNWSDEDKPFIDQTRDVESFHSIEISGNIELNLKKDSTQKVTVSSPDNFMSKVNTRVENGVLYISTNGIFLNRSIQVSVSTDSLKSITAKGACKINSEYELVARDFSLDLLGASEADLNIKSTGIVSVDAKGASKVSLKGNCQTFRVEGIGASEIDADELIAKVANIHVSGASHANVYASESLDAEAYGASNIDCIGHPKNIKKSDNIGSSINVE